MSRAVSYVRRDVFPSPQRHLYVGSLALAATVVLSACAQGSAPGASMANKAPAKPTATPIPPVLADYAQLVQPLLQMSSSEGQTLVSKMKQDSLSVVGDECTSFGGDLQSAEATIRGTYTPRIARSIYYTANTGYKLVLAATDECGLASDQNDKKQLKNALHDLQSGLYYLNQAYASTKKWHPVA